VQAFYTPEEVADRLRLHVKTVRQFLRDGRLRGTRVGKQYRISRRDLQDFAGGTGGTAPDPMVRQRYAEASSVVHIDAIDSATANRVTNTLMAALAGDDPEREPVRLDSIYDEERARLKLIISGDVESTAGLLKIINTLLED